MKSKSIAIIFLIFSTSCLLAQDRLPIPDKPGTWSYTYFNDENTKMYTRQFGMTAEEVAMFKQKLDNIVNVLHQNPVMANPKGVDPAVESRPLYPQGFENHSQNYGYIGEINFRLVTWYSLKGKVFRQTIEPPRVTVYINNIFILKRSAFSVGGTQDKDLARAEALVNEICKSDRIKELGPGVTLYDAAIVVGKPGKSLYLPCTVAEAYKRLIGFYELSVKKEPVFMVMLDGIKKEYSTLTPGQLNSPAYYGGEFSGITSQVNDSPLYLFNNDYFDRSMSKTAVQLIVIPIDADYFRKETDFSPGDVGFVRINQFLHSLDAAQLVKLID